MPRDSTEQARRVLLIGQALAYDDDGLQQIIDGPYFTFELTDSAATGLAKATSKARQFDAILIATDLPDGDGADLCSRLRERCVTTPVILLSQDSSEDEVVRGLDAGANDYVSAPFRRNEMVARLHAHIRAYEVSEDAVLKIGPFHFRPAGRLLHNTQSGERVRLTEKEASVLKYLYRATSPVTRHTLLHEVWGYNARTTTHTVETHIYRLRRKLEPNPNRISLLVNTDGGYRLCMTTPRSEISRNWQSAGMLAAL